MQCITASMIAMASGWGVLNSIWLVGSMFESSGFGFVLIFGVVSAFVVAIAWLVVFMPIYVLLDRDSMIFDWHIAILVGFAGGFLAGTICLGGSVAAGVMAGLVGGVAAGVGRYLLPSTEPHVTSQPREFHWDEVDPMIPELKKQPTNQIKQ